MCSSRISALGDAWFKTSSHKPNIQASFTCCWGLDHAEHLMAIWIIMYRGSGEEILRSTIASPLRPPKHAINKKLPRSLYVSLLVNMRNDQNRGGWCDQRKSENSTFPRPPYPVFVLFAQVAFKSQSQPTNTQRRVQRSPSLFANVRQPQDQDHRAASALYQD